MLSVPLVYKVSNQPISTTRLEILVLDNLILLAVIEIEVLNQPLLVV